jgi:hypothetical protein
VTPEKFSWLELKPQQKFKDDNENKMLEIIQYASEFAYFVFCNNGAMKLVVRTPENNQGLFKTIPGISVEPTKTPNFERMVTRYLTLKNRRSMVPLVDLKTVTKSNFYSKLWAEKRGCMMACFMYDNTKKILSEISKKSSMLERQAAAKSVAFSSKKKTELAAANQKRESHSHYNCTIIFGVQVASELSEIQTRKQRRRCEERHDFQSKVKNLKSFHSVESRKECAALMESYKSTVKKIENDFRTDLKAAREDIRESTMALDTIIRSVLLNSFAHRITTRRVKFSPGEKSFRQKLAEVFGMNTIDPYTFVPAKLHSKSMVLTEVELAFFMSLPQEYDIQTINFGMGPTPTFVHGNTEEVEESDLTFQCNHKALPDDMERLNRSVASSLRSRCIKCGATLVIKKDGSMAYTIDPKEDD